MGSVGTSLTSHTASGSLLLFAALTASLSLSLWGSLNRLASASHAHLTLSILLPYFHIVSLSAHTHRHVPTHCTPSSWKWADKIIPGSVACPASDLHCIPAGGVWGLCPEAGWRCCCFLPSTSCLSPRQAVTCLLWVWIIIHCEGPRPKLTSYYKSPLITKYISHLNCCTQMNWTIKQIILSEWAFKRK